MLLSTRSAFADDHQDGGTVAKEIELKTRSRTWARRGPRSCEQDQRRCGDGTTTATVLRRRSSRKASARRGRCKTDGAQARHRKGRHKGFEEIEKLSKPVTGDAIAQVGTVRPTATRRSARSSPKRWTRSARTASSRLKKQKLMDTLLEVVEGMQFDRGYLSPYFVTDADRMEPHWTSR